MANHRIVPLPLHVAQQDWSGHLRQLPPYDNLRLRTSYLISKPRPAVSPDARTNLLVRLLCRAFLQSHRRTNLWEFSGTEPTEEHERVSVDTFTTVIPNLLDR